LNYYLLGVRIGISFSRVRSPCLIGVVKANIGQETGFISLDDSPMRARTLLSKKNELFKVIHSMPTLGASFFFSSFEAS